MHPSQPLTESDLIFSSASSALKEALGELQKANLSIKNRLRSIKQDSDFVTSVAGAYNLPLVANERCGSWYIPLEQKSGSAYFKSTDGHFGQWAFSLRRLNLQVLDILSSHGGCIVVDSTRRGKSMPDALSKTVPIWTTVLNRILFPENPDCHQLRTPLDVVSESEHAQIESRLDEFVKQTRDLSLNLEQLRQKLRNIPIQVTWQRPGDTLTDKLGNVEPNLIVLCTASNQTSDATSATSEYVQGAADDPESWSHGLNAKLFWEHQEELVSIAEDDLPDLIDSLVTNDRAIVRTRDPILIKPTRCLFIGDNAAAETHMTNFDIVVSCIAAPNPGLVNTKDCRYIQLACSTGKVGSRQLRTQLAKLEDLRTSLAASSRILVTCDSGKDLAIGVALALLCVFFDVNGEAAQEARGLDINKSMIKQRLSWLMISVPDASPSRATLQSVNAFLMG